MKKLFLILTAVLSLTIVQGQNNKNLSSDKYSFPDTSFIPKDTIQLFSVFHRLLDSSIYVGHDTIAEAWYSSYLYAMKEPVIFTDKSPKEVYRFTWLRTFHNPVAIRIEKSENTYRIFWKLSNGAGGYQPGQLTIEKQKIIDKKTWDEFISRIYQINFWNIKTDKDYFGLDGSRWVLEGKTQSKYHVVDIWSPNKNGGYYQCCNFLIGLTDLKIKEKDKY